MQRNFTLLERLVSVLKAVSIIGLVAAAGFIIYGFQHNYGDDKLTYILYALGIACTASLPLFVVAELIRVFLQMEKNTWDTRNFMEQLSKKDKEDEKKPEPKQSLSGKTLNEIYR